MHTLRVHATRQATTIFQLHALTTIPGDHCPSNLKALPYVELKFCFPLTPSPSFQVWFSGDIFRHSSDIPFKPGKYLSLGYKFSCLKPPMCSFHHNFCNLNLCYIMTVYAVCLSMAQLMLSWSPVSQHKAIWPGWPEQGTSENQFLPAGTIYKWSPRGSYSEQSSRSAKYRSYWEEKDAFSGTGSLLYQLIFHCLLHLICVEKAS